MDLREMNAARKREARSWAAETRRSTTCPRCSGPKVSGHALDRKCFFALPWRLRVRLNAKTPARFQLALQGALDWLEAAPGPRDGARR